MDLPVNSLLKQNWTLQFSEFLSFRHHFTGSPMSTRSGLTIQGRTRSVCQTKLFSPLTPTMTSQNRSTQSSTVSQIVSSLLGHKQVPDDVFSKLFLSPVILADESFTPPPPTSPPSLLSHHWPDINIDTAFIFSHAFHTQPCLSPFACLLGNVVSYMCICDQHCVF